MRKYPRLAGFRPYQEPQPDVKCRCGQPAIGRLTIETNWFRGDDRTEPRCEAHQATISAIPQRLWVVGHWPHSGKGWELAGIYSVKKDAIKACLNRLYFIGPIRLNEAVPPNTPWAEAIYPNPAEPPKPYVVQRWSQYRLGSAPFKHDTDKDRAFVFLTEADQYVQEAPSGIEGDMRYRYQLAPAPSGSPIHEPTNS